MASALDQGVGEILGALKESGAYEHSIVVFSSDNGAQQGQVDQHADLGLV